MRMSWTAVGRAALYSMHHQGCVETKTMTQHDAVPDIQKPLSRVASRCIFALACMMPVEHGLTCTSGLQAREQLRQVRAQCRDLASDLDIARRQAAVRSSRSAVPPKPLFSVALSLMLVAAMSDSTLSQWFQQASTFEPVNQGAIAEQRELARTD